MEEKNKQKLYQGFWLIIIISILILIIIKIFKIVQGMVG